MTVVEGLHHAGIRTFDMELSKQFWCGVVGLVAHPEMANWLGLAGSDRRFIHLMPARGVSESSAGAQEDALDLADHVAIEVSDLKAMAAHLLKEGCKPFQAEVDTSQRREIVSADGPLDFGIGTVFVFDPAGNVVEFIQRGVGIFAKFKG